jgi:rhodanese-related sulfurtransferase
MVPTTAAAMIAAARQRIANLSVDQVAADLARGETLLVDVREPAEQAQYGGIPGALPAARGLIEFWADPTSPYHRSEFDPTRPTILYSGTGGRSALAAEALRRLGYTRVAHLDGGLKAWKNAGRPVVTAPPNNT